MSLLSLLRHRVAGRRPREVRTPYGVGGLFTATTTTSNNTSPTTTTTNNNDNNTANITN